MNEKGKELLQEVSNDLQDVKFQMTWSFHSFIPFVSSLCPSVGLEIMSRIYSNPKLPYNAQDTYTIYKRGSRVRIDTTLVGYEKLNWVRGNISIIFIGDGPGKMVF